MCLDRDFYGYSVLQNDTWISSVVTPVQKTCTKGIHLGTLLDEVGIALD